MKLKQLALTALLAGATLIGASARAENVSNTYPLVVLDDRDGGLSAVFGRLVHSFGEYPGYFADTYTFTATTPFEYAGSLTSLYQTYSDDVGHRVTKHVSISEFSLYTYDTANHRLGTLVAQGTRDSGGNGSTASEHWSFAGGWNQSPGDYALYIQGGSSAVVGGTYAGDFSVLAVPEPETWAMLLAGLGLVGFSARRRAKG